MKRLTKAFLLMLGVGALGCAETGDPVSISPDSSVAVTSAPENLSISEEHLLELVRSVGIALQMPEFRTYLYERLSSSPFPENQVQLRDLLYQYPSSDLINSVENHLTPREGGLAALLDSLPRELEVYFAIENQRTSWKPHSNFDVVTMFSEDGAIWGFNPTGGPVSHSVAEIPTRPTLSIVFAERTYPEPRHAEDPTLASDVAAGIPSSQLSALASSVLVRMQQSTVYDAGVYDPWPLGAPEFEVHAYKNYDGEDEATWASCAGQNADLGYRYNQNEDTWSGDVFLVDLRGEPESTRFGLQMWEKDQTTDCVYPHVGSGHPISPEDMQEQVKQDIKEAGKIALSCGLLWTMGTGNPVQGAFATVGCAAFMVPLFGIAAISGAFNADDYVGTLSRPQPECFRDATGPLHYDIRTGLTKTGYVSLEVEGVDRARICITGVMSGPKTISSAGTYEWAITDLAGGDGTYTYQWSYRANVTGSDWIYLGTGSTESRYVGAEADDFIMRVEVYSAGLYYTSQIPVDVQSGGCADGSKKC